MLLAVIAAVADGRGAHHAAFDALLAAVPFTAVAALQAFDAYLGRRSGSFLGLQALLWALALALVVLSCAARSASAQVHAVPPLAGSSLVACLAVFLLKAVLALAPHARLALRPAKP